MDKARHRRQRPADIELPHRFQAVLRKHLEQIGTEAVAVEIDRRLAGDGDRVGQSRSIAIGGGEKDFDDPLPQFIVDPPDHAAVENADPLPGQHEDIPRMRIGMIEAVAEDHLDEHAGAPAGKGVAVNIRLPQVLGIPDAHSVEPLHRQHPAGGQIRVRLGERHSLVGGEILAELEQVAHLAAEIELAQHGLTEFAHDGGRLVTLQLIPPLRQ